MSGADSVTVLTTKGPLATKRITLPPGATGPVIDPYGNAAFFSIWEAPVSGINDLAALIETIEQRPTSFLVRGKPAAGVDYRNARRRLHSRKGKDGTAEPATLEPAARHWIPLDFDSIPCPDWLDPVFEPDQAVEHVVGLLPEEFHGATCWWGFTSGQNIKSGLRIRLFFWADRPLADSELRRWLADARVDPSIFTPAQPIYVARPMFVGMPDPVPFRSGVWRGDRDEITPPTIEKQRVRASTQAGQGFAGSAGTGYEFHRSQIGDHEGGRGFHGPVKAAVAAWIGGQGAAVDTAWLRADLERAIREAPRDPRKHDDHYIEFRVGDLDPLIAAIRDLQAAKEAEEPRCDTYYPAPLGSVAEARAMLAAAMDRFAAAALAHDAPMAMAA